MEIMPRSEPYQPTSRGTDRPSTTAVGIRLRGVIKVFDGGVEALGPIDLDVPAGQFVALLGPSGSGKTTLLRCLAGLVPINAGTVELVDDDGHAASNWRHNLAFVFQSPHLMPWRSVLRNVELPLELTGVDRKTRRAAAEEALEQVQLADALTRYPAELSGGMAMRVSLARALVTRPRLLLMDEPFGALDELTRMVLDEKLHELWVRQRPTVVFVTHSSVEATFLAERAVVLSPRPARIALDHRVALPPDRRRPLRSEASFHAQSDALFSALATGIAATNRPVS
jgi:NitT/TauT family transport system ATP-binding protein